MVNKGKIQVKEIGVCDKILVSLLSLSPASARSLSPNINGTAPKASSVPAAGGQGIEHRSVQFIVLDILAVDDRLVHYSPVAPAAKLRCESV